MGSYCGVIKCNCKYHDEEEGCMFYYMGSGEEEDKPCFRDDEDEEDDEMKFITLERPDVYTNRPIGNGQIERGLVTQLPVTINPQYIVSMIESFDSSKTFESTEIYLLNGTYYHVTSRIEEIIEMIGGSNE